MNGLAGLDQARLAPARGRERGHRLRRRRDRRRCGDVRVTRPGWRQSSWRWSTRCSSRSPTLHLSGRRRAELHDGGNTLSISKVQRGDVDAALAGAAHVVSESFRTQAIEHAFLEPDPRSRCPTATARSRSTPRARASGTIAARSRRSWGFRGARPASPTCRRAVHSARKGSQRPEPCSPARGATGAPCS